MYMKIRNGFVSNSSSSSFIACQCVSSENFRKIVDECLFEIWCDRAKKQWKTSELTKRQLKAVKRDMYASEEYKELSINKFIAVNHLNEWFPYGDINQYNGKIAVNGDSYYLNDLAEKLGNKIKGIYCFWG